MWKGGMGQISNNATESPSIVIRSNYNYNRKVLHAKKKNL
jgi:hypothetical protein